MTEPTATPPDNPSAGAGDSGAAADQAAQPTPEPVVPETVATGTVAPEGAPDAEAPDPAGADQDRPTPAPPAGGAVMLLGSGAFTHELALAFQRLGAEVIAVDEHADAPAQRVADRSAVVNITDADAVTAVIDREKPRYVVVEAAHVATDALIAVAERGEVEVFPTPRSARLSLDREGLRRLVSDELGLPTAPFWFASSADELAAVARHAGFPLVVKPITAAAGEGESVLVRPEDVEPAFTRAVTAGRAPQHRVMVETVVDVDFQVSLLTIRTVGPAGPVVHFCEPIGHRFGDDHTLESWQPQQLSPAARGVAKSIGARIVNSLGGRGVFGVELLVHGDEVYFDSVTPRPPDSGLVTLRSQRLSQFELHARAILGLPLDTIMVSPGAADVHYADSADDAPDSRAAHPVVTEALAVAESDLRLLGGADGAGSRRRRAVALATAPDPIVARDRARRVSAVLRKIW
ncbi:carbamoyl-phosphate synthase L chain, ATP binding domain protein [Mycolicibacterium hassiacum DSM 44199]|jgi:phosphoribosylglycinamide formyltransferase 2|uniref:Carbamoyl-phosphate synthase L chain, ATP binding domain protein n=1 Tax=Mycolicibacterium hassiacum (strain DSM 44199 / CIP 105218 / JCM 12690 / 3849) TaxID=1122247 RepID=K5BHZ7_MYCHD|nr:formate-dependent phosphoribosylglycinamide formyltransferase [Mycolicibacterium hassiacum]EKF25441.1 carbamoyl-phosphate synthase L chain, ATP binding domain protein [Mycolicibacterium hassiacum DSM 44199]MBX5488365.1 formate-dependent phosphoribosylglycinamide formyltransferase [Mycolicibacterium hassiacum]MDA4086151.1 phosphoribosylglycinamide formyltransferase [Mycolicibacterium hassiacum DSM 44199]VCT92968.1 Formate-dependent phosphoribosylglycinamide formyltransferase [Mycolicibacteriu